MAHKKIISDDIIVEAYSRLRSVWKVAREVGIGGQSVHERCVKLGIVKKINKFNRIGELKEKYNDYCSSGRLQELADSFGVTKTTLCRIAGRHGLTDRKRPPHESEIKKRRLSPPKTGEMSMNWKGGVTKSNNCLFETYDDQISYAEETRKDPNDNNLLQTKCTYCGKWFNPTRGQIKSRKYALTSGNGVENRLYCSDECKKQCPVFKKQKHVLSPRSSTSREVQPSLRKIVFERDGWACQKCGEICGLQCHHFEGIRQNPIESADVDMCITLCSGCHRKVHKQKGCRPQDLMCPDNQTIRTLTTAAA